MASLTHPELGRKLQLLSIVLPTLTRVDPGYSGIRGKLLQELNKTKVNTYVIRANFQFNIQNLNCPGFQGEARVFREPTIVNIRWTSESIHGREVPANVSRVLPRNFLRERFHQRVKLCLHLGCYSNQYKVKL